VLCIAAGQPWQILRPQIFGWSRAAGHMFTLVPEKLWRFVVSTLVKGEQRDKENLVPIRAANPFASAESSRIVARLCRIQQPGVRPRAPGD
jgi:hypothetical protein